MPIDTAKEVQYPVPYDKQEGKTSLPHSVGRGPGYQYMNSKDGCFICPMRVSILMIPNYMSPSHNSFFLCRTGLKIEVGNLE